MDTTANKREKVLVVDDERGIRELLVFGLTDRGYDVSTAANGDEAIAAAGETEFAIVFSDIMMPGKGGVEVLQRIKEIHPATEVIMATGFATLETAIESMKCGAYDYIPKPYELDQLCGVLEKALEHQRLKARVSKLEEVNQIKYESLTGMIADLRDPLDKVAADASRLLNRAGGDGTEEHDSGLKRIIATVEGLIRTTENIQHLSRLSTALTGMEQLPRTNLEQ